MRVRVRVRVGAEGLGLGLGLERERAFEARVLDGHVGAATRVFVLGELVELQDAQAILPEGEVVEGLEVEGQVVVRQHVAWLGLGLGLGLGLA